MKSFRSSGHLPGVVRALIRCAVVATAMLSLPHPGSAQEAGEWDSGRLELTRAGLQEMLARYEQTATSSAYSSTLRQEATAVAESIRLRLREGDFRPGDEVELNVEGEQDLQGRFVVESDGSISLPVFGEVPLHGILRSELQEFLRARLATYLINPAVTARSSIRLMISGTVAQPGIYVVPTQQLLSSVVMESGRPGAQADLRAMRIERGGTVLWDPEQLENAVAQGLTVDQLGLRSGDHVFIPALEPPRNIGQLLSTGIPALLLAVTSLMQVF